MKFDLSQSISILEKTPQILVELLSGLEGEWILSNEGPNTWSPYDIVGHLIHGELTDWIPRARIILSDHDDKVFTPFDRFAQFENSKGKSIDELLHHFKKLRTQNILELKGYALNHDMLDFKGTHPEFGEVTLRQLLATWVVHDFNHINQMTRVLAKYYKDEVGLWKNYMPLLQK